MATKEVRFDIYCKTCKYYNKEEHEDPCWDCLNEGWNENSNKPIYWKEKDIYSDNANTTVSRQKHTPK